MNDPSEQEDGGKSSSKGALLTQVPCVVQVTTAQIWCPIQGASDFETPPKHPAWGFKAFPALRFGSHLLVTSAAPCGKQPRPTPTSCGPHPQGCRQHRNHRARAQLSRACRLCCRKQPNLAKPGLPTCAQPQRVGHCVE